MRAGIPVTTPSSGMGWLGRGHTDLIDGSTGRSRWGSTNVWARSEIFGSDVTSMTQPQGVTVSSNTLSQWSNLLSQVTHSDILPRPATWCAIAEHRAGTEQYRTAGAAHPAVAVAAGGLRQLHQLATTM